VLEILLRIENIRTNKNAKTLLLSDSQDQFIVFYNTIRNLIILLRELHKINREISGAIMETTAKRKLCEMSVLYIDLAILYFRRINHQFGTIGRMLCFDYYKDIKGKLDRWNIDNMDSNNIICNLELLKSALEKYKEYNNKINNLRNNLEHGTKTRILIGIQKSGDDLPKLTANFIEGNKVKNIDLINHIRDTCSILCAFFTKFCEAVDYKGKYGKTNAISLMVGNDNDITGFWPEI